MASLSPTLLSLSTSGKQIAVTAITSPGTDIHAATSVSGGYDEVWLYACNVTANTVTLTIQFGGTTAADSIVVQIPPQAGPVCVVAGIRVNGGIAIKAFASVASAINIHGNVNRWAP